MMKYKCFVHNKLLNFDFIYVCIDKVVHETNIFKYITVNEMSHSFNALILTLINCYVNDKKSAIIKAILTIILFGLNERFALCHIVEDHVVMTCF